MDLPSDAIVVRELESSPSVKLKSQTLREQNGSASSPANSTRSLFVGKAHPSPPPIHTNYSVPNLSSLSPGYMSQVSRSMERLTLQPGRKDSGNLAHLTGHITSVPQILLKNKKSLDEESKVLSVDWCFDSKHLVTSLQSGHLCIWDTMAKERVQIIQTPCTWVFAVSYSPSQNFVAAGGLDSKCDLYKLPRGKQTTIESLHVAQHQSYVLDCSFTTSDHQILTASSDSTCALWDVESAQMIREFKGHSSDVRSLDFQKSTGYCFLSGSADKQLGLWDMRTGNCVQSFLTHTDEVNQVRFFPNGEALASVSDDMTCRLFDLRMDVEIAIYKRNSVLFPACSLDFSLNGRLLFVGYSDHSFHVWDTLKSAHCGSMYSHENKVNCLKLSPDGSCLATGSWDQTVKLWS
ncbi:guanine nucleotide-binding protein subunit beta-5-like [Hydractinia symbiolongicarpus]|uniref:guanine nucleotide-binding protein subunit beta-5-like n=1 Tax=Hydractinia symbiolongicarpus TaxID=13093 RepID=UPI00254DAA9B|nr:guanine nucleotide-binding protein subunit beta-5-like [Hydractinia symbiolongicarpus]